MTAPKVAYVPRHYAVTVTLPSTSRKLPAEAQFDKYKERFINCFFHFKVSAVCELTSNYDIHFHAVCSVKPEHYVSKPQKYLKDVFRAQFGFTCIKEVTDFDGWINYLKKDIDNTTAHGLIAILRDDYNKLDNIIDSRIDMNDYEPDILG